MSMAHSLEVRVPLLDRKLVEAVLRLPAAIKTNHRPYPKPLLLAAVEEYLPKVVAERKQKMGFFFLLEHWLKGTLRGQSQAMLTAVDEQGWLQAGAVTRLERDFQADQLQWSRLWALVALGAVLPQPVMGEMEV